MRASTEITLNTGGEAVLPGTQSRHLPVMLRLETAHLGFHLHLDENGPPPEETMPFLTRHHTASPLFAQSLDCGFIQLQAAHSAAHK